MVSNVEFTGITCRVDGELVHQIRAIADMPWHGVVAGDVGGFVADARCVQDGAWVGPQALALQWSRLKGRASVTGRARVMGHAVITDEARMRGNAVIAGRAVLNARAVVDESSFVSDRARVTDSGLILGSSLLFGDCVVGGEVVVRSGMVSGDMRLRGKGTFR